MGANPLPLSMAPASSAALRLQVAEVITETADARSLVLRVPEELKARFGYRPGQFLSFRVPYQGKRLTRCYSMASSPDCDELLKVTIKRVAEGRVSNWMNDQVQVGDWLEVLPPAGHFVLTPGEHPLVLFAGGSGITPVMSILKSALRTSRRAVKLVYANRDDSSVIFREQLRSLIKAHPEQLQVVHLLDSLQGYVDAAAVRHQVRHWLDAECFICGPAPFMDAVEGTLLALGQPAERIHVERFVSPADPEPESDTPRVGPQTVCQALLVELDGVLREVPNQPGATLLQSCRAAGLDIPYSCEEGFCGACMCKVQEGEIELTRNDILSAKELQDGWTLACQGRPAAARVHLKFP